jgi:hypothetical protein
MPTYNRFEDLPVWQTEQPRFAALLVPVVRVALLHAADHLRAEAHPTNRSIACGELSNEAERERIGALVRGGEKEVGVAAKEAAVAHVQADLATLGGMFVARDSRRWLGCDR